MSDNIESKVRDAALALVEAFSTPAEQYAASRYLASIAFLREASAIKNEIIVTARTTYPEDTYEDTAARLGTTPATVNRAVTAHNRRAVATP
jgi:hypothetical protein